MGKYCFFEFPVVAYYVFRKKIVETWHAEYLQCDIKKRENISSLHLFTNHKNKS